MPYKNEADRKAAYARYCQTKKGKAARAEATSRYRKRVKARKKLDEIIMRRRSSS